MKKTTILTAVLIISATSRYMAGAGDVEKDFKVSAATGWQSTGLMIGHDHKLLITAVGGQWKGSKGDRAYGPEGSKGEPAACMPARMSGVRPGMLIGRIGNSRPFPVGEMYDGVPQLKGTLFLRMNDCDGWLSDNSGSVTVNIRVLAPRSL